MSLTQERITSRIHGDRSLHFAYIKNKEMSQKELEHRSKIFSRILLDSGCDKGDPICCIMNKSIDFLISLKGIQYAGATFLPINPNLTLDHIQSIILESGSKWIIADRSFAPSLKSSNQRLRSVNLGWMDSIDKLPENCLPEFVRDNIDYISLRPVVKEPEKSKPTITFYHPQNNKKLVKESFSQIEIEKYITPVLDIIDLDANSKVAGLMPCDSLSVMLETMSFSISDAQLFLFDSFHTHYPAVMSELQNQEITHVLVGSAFLEDFATKELAEKSHCPSVKTIVLWGKTSSKNTLKRLKQIFPNGTVYKIIQGHDNELSVQENGTAAGKFTSIANIPNKRKTQIK